MPPPPTLTPPPLVCRILGKISVSCSIWPLYWDCSHCMITCVYGNWCDISNSWIQKPHSGWPLSLLQSLGPLDMPSGRSPLSPSHDMPSGRPPSLPSHNMPSSRPPSPSHDMPSGRPPLLLHDMLSGRQLPSPSHDMPSGRPPSSHHHMICHQADHHHQRMMCYKEDLHHHRMICHQADLHYYCMICHQADHCHHHHMICHQADHHHHAIRQTIITSTWCSIRKTNITIAWYTTRQTTITIACTKFYTMAGKVFNFSVYTTVHQICQTVNMPARFLWSSSSCILYFVAWDPKTHKSLKKGFLIRQNKTEHDFSRTPLFQCYVQYKDKQITFLLPVGFLWREEGTSPLPSTLAGTVFNFPVYTRDQICLLLYCMQLLKRRSS